MEPQDASSGGVCPVVERAFRFMGRKWIGLIVHVLAEGDKRFSELAETVPGISARILSQRLAELESDGLVIRTVVPDSPVRVHYALTDKGMELGPVLSGLADWAHRWAGAAEHVVEGGPTRGGVRRRQETTARQGR